MSRFTMTLVAAVAAGVAAIALVALPAIGATVTKGQEQTPDVSHFAACLSAHGLPGAPTTAPELKPWLAGREAADPQTVTAAIDACGQTAPESGGPSPDIEHAIACVRSRGINAPTAPADFKRWIGQQQQQGRLPQALEHALSACNLAPPPGPKLAAPGEPGRGFGADKAAACAIKPEAPNATNGT
jgi:hypothetical protein